MVEFRLTGVFLIVAIFLVVLVNGDFLQSLRKLWRPEGGGEEGVKGKSFSSREGHYDGGGGGDPYMMSAASQRGWGGWGGGWGHEDHQNLDLYSLLGGLSFASLLGATIIYLARRNTSGRRRRSADGLSYLEEDEIDFSEDPTTKGLNIVELIDTFLDNRHIFFANDEEGFHTSGEGNTNESLINDVTTKRNNGSASNSSRIRLFIPDKIHLGPGILPHTLSDPIY